MKVSKVNASFFFVLHSEKKTLNIRKAEIFCTIDKSELCPITTNNIQTYKIIGKEIDCYFTILKKPVFVKSIVIEVNREEIKIYTFTIGNC